MASTDACADEWIDCCIYADELPTSSPRCRTVTQVADKTVAVKGTKVLVPKRGSMARGQERQARRERRGFGGMEFLYCLECRSESLQ